MLDQNATQDSLSTISSASPTCRHCGQILMTLNDIQIGYCCNGCKAAANFIAGLGLEQFYCLRQNGPEWQASPAEIVNSTYAHFDDPGFAERYIYKVSQNNVQIQFFIKGIHCAACVWVLEKLPEKIEGLISLRVELLKSKITLHFDPEKLKLSGLAHTIAALGYPPSPIGASDSRNNSSDKMLALRLGVAAFCSMNVMLLFIGRYEGLFSGIEAQYEIYFAYLSLLLSLPAVFFSAIPFYKTSLAAIQLQKLHIDLPITVAIIGGFVASAVNVILGRTEIYFDTVTALIFLLLCGRWCQAHALKRVGQASDLIYSVSPLRAFKLDPGNKTTEVYVESLKAGELVLVNSNEKFPCDGVVVSGKSSANLAILTGESVPQELQTGTKVWAGTENLAKELVVEVQTVGEQTRLGKILNSAQSSVSAESKLARFVDRISVYFVITVFTLAGLTFLFYLEQGFWSAWDRVIALLVVSCPCALGIATPVTLALASSQAARRGLLLRNPDALEKLSRIKKVFFDKTGTLTKGELAVSHIWLEQNTRLELVSELVAELEVGLEQPVAKALLKRFATSTKTSLFERKTVLSQGVTAHSSSGEQFKIGALNWLTPYASQDATMLQANELPKEAQDFVQEMFSNNISVVGLSRNDKIICLIGLSDSARAESGLVIKELKDRAITSYILSGDAPEIVERLATQMNVPTKRAFARLSPEDKTRVVKAYGEHAAMIGDGVNDAAAIAQAGVGIGIAGGAELCLKIADIYMTRPDLNLIIGAIDGAKKTVRLIHLHLAISLFYNITASTLAILGFISPLGAAIVMPASSLSVIVSSLIAQPFKGFAKGVSSK